jgi:uncharacterized protein
MTSPMRIINVIAALLIGFSAAAQENDFPQRSDRLVNDYADLLTDQEEAQLERKLVNYHDTTSTEIAVVTITSLGGYDAMDYAIQLGEYWGVGGSEFDNGILILVAKDERKLAIATGYGLEGAIPDAATFTIRDEYMQPYFSKGEFYTGLDKGTDILIALAEGEYTVEDIPGRNPDGGGGIAVLFILGFIIWTIFASRKANRYRKGAYGNRKMDFWTAFFMGSMLGGAGRSGRSWSDFNSGGGSFGGGGGFGGFGGGSFGGGGSAGSW